MRITSTYLFAPEEYNSGSNKCFYCGIDCGNEFTKKEYVKKTFTNRDIVHYPGSDYVCGCCVASLATVVETKLVDGEVKTGRGGAPRTYSWVLTEKENTAFSKKHLDFARSIFESPPVPPFSLVLADSGKKQIIFRAPVNYDRDHFVVQFEEEQIEIDLSQWKYYLETATITSAAIGKKYLLEPEKFTCFLNTEKFFGSLEPLENWIKIHNEPMAKIAAWVCKGKEDARNEAFVSARIQKENSGSCRPAKRETEQRPAGGNEAVRDQLLFDFA